MTLRVFVLAFSAWTALACGLGNDIELADSAVAVFHQKYAAATDPGLGAIHKTRRIGFEVTDGSEGGVVELEYDTEFAQGRAIERFVWRISDGKARLLSYTVTPTAK